MESGSSPPERPGPESPEGPQAPAPGPQAPAPKAPPIEETPAYAPIPDGPETPPSGWQQPIATAPGTGRPLASWGSRVAATIIDWILSTLVVWVGVGLAVGGSEVAGGVVALLGLFLVFFYYPLTMMRSGQHNGQTLGKQALGITVSRDSGEAVGFWWAVLREFVVEYLLFQVVGSFLFGLPWLLDVLWPLWERENRALHDLMLSSHVVKV
jgi:uncharacterized RDD family membrane protein YckC